MAGDVPRVTYSNIGVDFSPVHDLLDRAIPAFKEKLGRRWPNRIAGAADTDGAAYVAVSPIDDRIVLGEFYAAGPAAVARAVGAAKAAFTDWSRRPWTERVKLLRAAADVLSARKYDHGVACLLEVGKSRLEAMGEAEEAVDLIRYYCDEMERNAGYAQEMRRAFAAEATRVVLRPVGVFGVIAPFNFPLALSVNMMAAALLAGNTVVYKPSERAGLTGALLMEALAAAGLPEGVVNLVCGEEAGRHLVDDPDLDGVVFTGSHAVGMEIYRKLAAGAYARPVIVEMGGKNPTYVTAFADLEVAVEGVVRSAFGLQGQKCSAGSVAYVDRRVLERFLTLLAERTAQIKVGNPEARDVFMGPLIDAAAADRYARAVAEAAAEGRVVHGGRRLQGELFDHGHYVEPAIVTRLDATHRLNRDELFLPFLSVVPVASLSQGISYGNAVGYGLTAGVYTTDADELAQFLDTAEAGVLYANRASGATTGAWPGIQSFCGWKGSGITGKGGLGPWYLPQFLREQSRTVMG